MLYQQEDDLGLRYLRVANNLRGDTGASQPGYHRSHVGDAGGHDHHRHPRLPLVLGISPPVMRTAVLKAMATALNPASAM